MPSSLDLSFLQSRAAQKRMAAVTVAFVILGLLYALLAPRWYRSVLTVVPAKQQRGGISSILAGELGGFAAGLESSGGTVDAARIAAVLQSIVVSDAVIEKFDLRARYSQKYQEKTRDELWGHCAVKPFPKPNLVQLSCEDKDPRFVQALLGYFAEYGNQVFRRVSVSSASEEARFLEARVAELRTRADEAADTMRQFQEEHRIIDLDTQAKAVVSAMAALNTQSITKQLELEYARTYSAGDEATTRQLRSQLSLMRDKLRDLEEPAPGEALRLENQPASGGDKRGVFPAALTVPKLRAQFEKLYRDRKVAEATLIFALERLEAAKANEARDVSTFLVLDPPALPTRHSRPSRLLTIAAALLLGVVLAVSLEIVRGAGGPSALLAALGNARRRAPAPRQVPPARPVAERRANE